MTSVAGSVQRKLQISADIGIYIDIGTVLLFNISIALKNSMSIRISYVVRHSSFQLFLSELSLFFKS